MAHPSDAVNVCVHCGMLNEELKDFCVRCGGPLTAHAVFDPFDMIKTQGFVYRSASKSPQKSIVVVFGMWLLMGPMFLAGLSVVLDTLGALTRRGFHPLAFLPLGIGCGMLWISGTLIGRTMANYQRAAAGSEAALDADEAEKADDEEEGDDAYWRIPGDKTDADERSN